MNIKEVIAMENMVNVYLFGKKYAVPEGLTIMTAMEYVISICLTNLQQSHQEKDYLQCLLAV